MEGVEVAFGSRNGDVCLLGDGVCCAVRWMNVYKITPSRFGLERSRGWRTVSVGNETFRRVFDK